MVIRRGKRESVVQPQDQSIKIIALTKGQVATIDACEYERAMKLLWAAAYRKSINGYYAAAWTKLSDGTRKQIFMHHFVVGSDMDHVDHHDGNGLNNTRENLRPCTHSQNHANAPLRADNTSGYKGVSWSKHLGKWEAYVTANQKKRNLGYFSVKEDAARAYNAAALELFGEFAKLNHVP